MAEEATKNAWLKIWEKPFVTFTRHNAYADLLINKLVTCQIIFNPNITYTYKLQLQKFIKCTTIEG